MRGPSRPSEPDEEAPPEAPLADRTRMEPPPVPPPNRRGAKSRLRVVEEESPEAESEPESDPEPEERGSRGRKSVSTRPAPREAAETRIAQSEQVLAPPDPGDDSDATAAGPPISVEVVHGPDSGKRKRVRGGRMVVGRGDGCDLKLVDTAASRRHLELIVGMSGAVVRDLGSGNGTKVNGERIEDEATIQHGDEIVLGTTVLKVVDELQELEERRRPKQPEAPPDVEPADEEAPAPAPRGRKPSKQLRVPGTEAVEIPESAGRMGKGGRKQNPMVLAGLAMGAVVVLGLLVMVLRPSHPATDDGDTSGAHGKSGKGGKANKGDVASEAIAKAKNALRENNYDAALAAADEALAADPDNIEAQEYKKRIGLEKDGAAKLSGGMALLAANQFADARKILGGIPPESTAADKAAAELKVLDTKEAEYVFGQATQKLEAGDVDGAVTDQIRLATLVPERGEELGRQIAAKKSELEHQAALDAKRFRNKKERERELKRQKAENSVRAELDAGYRKFKAGEFDRASSEFEHIAESTKNADAKKRAKELAKAVRIFNANYQQVQEHEAEKAYEVEIKPLDSTIVAYQQIDPSGPLLGKLKSMLARDLVIKGQSAAARHDYGLAARAYRKALEVKPGLTDAKDGLNNLRSHAHETYLQAYEEEPRDAESARKLYTSVCDMLGPNDEDCVKAKKRMENLANRN